MGDQLVFLEGEPDMTGSKTAALRIAELRDVSAFDFDCAPVGHDQAGKRVQEGRFPTPGFTDDGKQPRVRQVKIHPF